MPFSLIRYEVEAGVCTVTLSRPDRLNAVTTAMLDELRDHVAHKIGKIARPHGIIFTDDLPKTRSGKIMRRLLRDVACGRPLGDCTTLANADVVEQINEMVEAGAAEE